MTGRKLNMFCPDLARIPVDGSSQSHVSEDVQCLTRAIHEKLVAIDRSLGLIQEGQLEMLKAQTKFAGLLQEINAELGY